MLLLLVYSPNHVERCVDSPRTLSEPNGRLADGSTDRPTDRTSERFACLLASLKLRSSLANSGKKDDEILSDEVAGPTLLAFDASATSRRVAGGAGGARTVATTAQLPRQPALP